MTTVRLNNCAYLNLCSHDTFCRIALVHQGSEFSVREVYPGGSYGKGTTVGARSDVDILVVINGLPTENHERWLHVVLSKLRTLMEMEFPG